MSTGTIKDEILVKLNEKGKEATQEEIDEALKLIEEGLENVTIPFTLSLYLNSYIDEESVLPIIKGIRKANYPTEITYEETFSPDLSGDFIYKEIDKIILHINSPGGSVDSGLALVHEIEKSEIPIECIITNAHSMAFLVAIVCNTRKIHKYGKLMWHDAMLGMSDKVKGITDFLKVVEKENIIMENTIMKYTDLTSKELKEIITKKQDRYYFPEEALAKKIVDEII